MRGHSGIRNLQSYDRLYIDLYTSEIDNTAMQRRRDSLPTTTELTQNEMTDEELMQAVCLGDKAAYQALVKQHLQSISHYAFRLLGNSKDTEDVSQEVFLRLWTNAKKWNPQKAKLSTWLHRIAHNLCIDYLRKHGRMQTRDSFEEDSDESTELGHEQSGQSDESLKQLRAAMNSLPENQRSALSLCHFQGFSNKEAAAIMNISVKALESAIARAKRSLRDTLISSRENQESPITANVRQLYEKERKLK